MNRGALEGRNARQTRLFKVLNKSNSFANTQLSAYINRVVSDGGVVEAPLCVLTSIAKLSKS